MSGDLKRLGFVQAGTTLACSEAERLYKTLRSYAPQFVAPRLEKAEDTFMSALSPVATRAQVLGDRLLHFADNRVDYVMSTTEKAVSQGRSGVSYSLQSVKDIREQNMKALSSALESYYNFMSKTAEHVVEQLNVSNLQAATVQTVQAARDTLQSGVRKAREATDPDVAVDMAWDAWSTFSALPPVAKLLDTAEPATKMGLQAFNKLHDTLVTTPLYKTFVNGTTDSFNYAATTTPYKLGAQYLYPIVQPVADPAISKVTHSKVIGQVVDYWRPAPAAVAVH